jgi:carboxynorspermidine decarboxylase
MREPDVSSSVNIAPTVRTPAYVFDEATLVADAESARDALARAGVQLLYAMKACAFGHALGRLAGIADGFHASSLFEAQLGREILGEQGLIHVTSPSLAASEIGALSALSDMISLNSLAQWYRLGTPALVGTQIGLRVNPERSFVSDERYDPCRRHSKLGAPVSELRDLLNSDPGKLDGLRGVLVHGNSESRNFDEVLSTVRHLDHALSPLLDRIAWINLGGGYLFRDPADYRSLDAAVALLRDKYGLSVYMEPGTSIIERAACLITTVQDVFPSAGKTVAILDASVNHMPECYEYQFEPEIEGTLSEGGHRYILAGATCLAGDILGEFGFLAPLSPGDRLVIRDAGAYTMVKAHMFNGVNLPSVYWQPVDGDCELVKTYTYNDFKARCGL